MRRTIEDERTCLTLAPPGKREVVDECRAEEIVDYWVNSDVLRKENAVVTKVVLSNKAYTAGAAKKLAVFFATSTSEVASVDLSDIIATRMEEEGMLVLSILSNAFSNATRLTEVDLSDNALGSKGVDACRSLLALSSLDKISLCNNGLSETAMSQLADIFTENQQQWIKIHFHNNMSGDGGCRAMARILDNTTKLQDLRFSGTRAGRPGSMVVANALDSLGEARIQHLTYLDLADNSFGSEGATPLSKALSSCRNLIHLNLRDCVLEDGGVQRVCHALFAADSPLQYLDLSGNEITHFGAQSISDLLSEESGSTLQVLNLEENELTSKGVKIIAKCIPESVKEIRLGCNECGTIGAKALVDAAKRAKHWRKNTLKLIDLDRNMFTQDDIQSLRRAFGTRLVDMEDNDEENADDADDGVSDNDDDDEEEDDDDDEGVEQVQDDTEVDALAKALAKGVAIDSFC